MIYQDKELSPSFSKLASDLVIWGTLGEQDSQKGHTVKAYIKATKFNIYTKIVYIGCSFLPAIWNVLGCFLCYDFQEHKRSRLL